MKNSTLHARKWCKKMFHQLRIRRKAVLTAARRKKYAKCDTLQCTGTWADPTGMIFFSMLGFFWQWHHIWNLCIRTGDSDTPSGVLIIAHPASSWSGGFQLSAPTCWPVAYLRYDSATAQNEMDMDMADMGQNDQVTSPRKKKKASSLVWLHCYPSLTQKKKQFSDKSKPARPPSGWDWSDFVKCCWGCSVSCYQPQSAQFRNPSKKTRENHPHFEPESNWLMPKKTFYLDSIYWQNHLKVLFNWFQ